MLSFEISAIDVVLLIAVMVLLLLFLTQKKGPVPTESRLTVEEREELVEKPETKSQNARKKSSIAQSPRGFQGCIHQFGYLKNLPQNTAVPDECFGCPKVMRCLFPSEQIQKVH